MDRAELRLSDRQRLLVLLYLARKLDVHTLMGHLRTCEEMSLLRLPSR